jgi:hypothetical protein
MIILKKLKNFMIITLSSLAIIVPSISISAPSIVMADCGAGATATGSYINSGVNTAFGSNNSCQNGTPASSSLATIAKTVVNIFSLIVGIVAVIMIIYGGFRYITSGGESGAVGNAKNTIIYAIVGLILVALAQTLVHFVLNASAGTVTTQ